MDRNRRSPWLKLCAAWQAADFYGRAWITFQLTVAVLCGLLAGLATTVIVVALVVAA